MKKLLVVMGVLGASMAVWGQVERVGGRIATADTADLSVLGIYPESFPEVSVVFRAQTRAGEPLWDLVREEMRVEENGEDCEVVSLEKISENKPIQLGIVIDHSVSMLEDLSQLFDEEGRPLFTFDGFGGPVLPEGYVAPLDHAKAAVKTFVSSFNTQKDFISITGFAGTVDPLLPLTQDIGAIRTWVESLEPDGGTALYDGMMVGLQGLQGADGVRVLVVLTDGQDNASSVQWSEVVDRAVEMDIPIFLIGLGEVNQEVLQQIAQATKGQAYFTQSSNSLDEVYAQISRQVQAFYNLVYRSSNLSSADSTRQIELAFEIENLFLVGNPASWNLPPEVIAFLEQKEKQRTYLLYGGALLAVLMAGGALLYTYRRQRSGQPRIHKLYPNPSAGVIQLEINVEVGQIQITSLHGHAVKSLDIAGREAQLDLSDVPDGTYVAVLQSGGQPSNGVKFILQR